MTTEDWGVARVTPDMIRGHPGLQRSSRVRFAYPGYEAYAVVPAQAGTRGDERIVDQEAFRLRPR